jgi:hypothetical protein
VHRRLWSLIRDEAATAEREILMSERAPDPFRGGGFAPDAAPRRAVDRVSSC